MHKIKYNLLQRIAIIFKYSSQNTINQISIGIYIYSLLTQEIRLDCTAYLMANFKGV